MKRGTDDAWGDGKRVSWVDVDPSESEDEIRRLLKTQLVGPSVMKSVKEEDEVKKIRDRLIYAWFERTSAEGHELVQKSSLVCLKDKFRCAEDPRTSIYALGCLDRKVTKKGRPPASCRLYFLGFILPTSTEIILGNTVEEEYELHGTRIGDQAVVFPCSALTLECPREDAVQPEEEEEKDEEPMQMILSKEVPSRWIYIYHGDTVRTGTREERVHLNMNLEEEVLRRIDVLCNPKLQSKDLPITDWDCYVRDKVCIHFLIYVCCLDETMKQWYAEHEGMLLANNLKALTDYEDRILTLKLNMIDMKCLSAANDNDGVASFEDRVTSICVDRLYAGMTTCLERLIAEEGKEAPGYDEMQRFIQYVQSYIIEGADLSSE